MTTIPPDPPESLRAAAPLIARARDVDRVDRPVAYWCLFYAAQLALGTDANARDRDAQAYLVSLLDALEQMKDSLRSEPAVTDSAAAAAHVESFALSVFYAADTDDRDGRASRDTARAFAAASKFLETLAVFGPVAPEITTKIRYAKWKAADISKALREGRLSQRNQVAADAAGGEEHTLPPPEPSAPAAPDPAMRAQTHVLPSVPSDATGQQAAAPPDPPSAPPSAPALAPAPAPPSAPPSAPTPPPAAPPSTRPPLDVRTVTHIQKLTRWASSALDYDDSETARRHLREALAALDGV